MMPKVNFPTAMTFSVTNRFKSIAPFSSLKTDSLNPVAIVKSLLILSLLAAPFAPASLQAQEYSVLHNKSQMTFTGKLSPTKALPPTFSRKARDLLIVDNGFTKTFLPAHEIAQPVIVPGKLNNNFLLEQKVAPELESSIPYTPVVLTPNVPFDEFGRRVVKANTHRGIKYLVQGITRLTPEFAEINGIQMSGRKEYEAPFREMIATSSIPPQTLVKMLRNATEDLKNKDDRLKIILFLVATKRYSEARSELRSMVIDFPGWSSTEQYKDFRETIANDIAKSGLRELEKRFESGQRKLVMNLIQNIDTSEVATDVLLDFNALRKKISQETAEIEKLKQMIAQDLDIIANLKSTEKPTKEELLEVKQEILSQIGVNNYKRFSTYLLRQSEKENKKRLAFMITGWYLGSSSAIDNFQKALAIRYVKKKVVEYLQCTDPGKRTYILEEIRQSEGGSVDNIAKIARHITPWKSNIDATIDKRGIYHITLKQFASQPKFFVSLPPEYDPYKKYPCIVTLCDSYQGPMNQLAWWKTHADRNGYIVIAPDWREADNKEYSYDAYPTMVTLAALREARRRFSVDSNRVFISGYLRGAEAAVDIGLAHPDLWAGIVNISAIFDKYINSYKPNIESRVPVYSVIGSRHGAPARGKIGNMDKREGVFKFWADNGRFNSIVVFYMGRQSENFFEECKRIFQWCGNQQRKFVIPDNKFKVRTLRRWDNFFWWMEAHSLPEDKHLSPYNWDRVKKRNSLTIEGRQFQNAKQETVFDLSGCGESATFWLSPNWTNFQKKIHFSFGRRKKITVVKPSRKIILEDLRTRSDVFQPFWANFSFLNGKEIINATPQQIQGAR